MRSWSSALVAAALVLGAASAASATAVYAYAGSNYDAFLDDFPPSGTYSSDMRVSGTVELPAPLPANLPLTSIEDTVLEFSFDDGRGTITEDDSFVFELAVTTDSSGDIDTWELLVTLVTLPPSTGFGRFIQADSTAGDRAELFTFAGSDIATASVPGVWAMVPEPSAAVLLSAGLAVLAARRR